MATRIIGKVAFRPRGNWDALVSDYERLDTVVDDNVMYIALQNVPAGTPVSDSTYWQRSISGSGSSSQLDTAMSDTSTNGVQNRVIKAYVDEQAARIDGLTTDVSAKASTEYVNGELDKKVDKEDGKVLSSNDYTNEDKALVGTIERKVNLTESGANELINTLTTATATPQDDDYYISQRAGGSTATYFRRKTSALWAYIKSKILSDEVYTSKCDKNMFMSKAIYIPADVTLAANTTGSRTSVDIQVSGYTPLAIRAQNTGVTNVIFHRFYINNTTLVFWLRNTGTSSQTVEASGAYVTVLYGRGATVTDAPSTLSLGDDTKK